MSQGHNRKPLPPRAVFLCLELAAVAFWGSIFFGSQFCPPEWRWLANWASALVTGTILGLVYSESATSVFTARARATVVRGQIILMLAFGGMHVASGWWLPSAKPYLNHPLVLLLFLMSSLFLGQRGWRSLVNQGRLGQASPSRIGFRKVM
jgi:hypothetical protein